jgi:hypothetical protein
MSQIALEYSLRYMNSTTYFVLWPQSLIAQRVSESPYEIFPKPRILKVPKFIQYIEERRMFIYKCSPEGGACDSCLLSFDKAGNGDLLCWCPWISSSDCLRPHTHSRRVWLELQSTYKLEGMLAAEFFEDAITCYGFEDIYILCDWSRPIDGATHQSIYTAQMNTAKAVQIIYQENSGAVEAKDIRYFTTNQEWGFFDDSNSFSILLFVSNLAILQGSDGCRTIYRMRELGSVFNKGPFEEFNLLLYALSIPKGLKLH